MSYHFLQLYYYFIVFAYCKLNFLIFEKINLHHLYFNIIQLKNQFIKNSL